ncbi:helix-turn-helix transcriptional regulator [Streptomyces monomycini]|uniref:helix-turn-helix transcriptional regulator n=1 Tax=Streptomyces monomycini TaxID=371720 RepID=UPI0004ABD001|nr:LuxR C-terminal-related transcriptional regulator [Streptomyces monomycini]
MSARPKGSDRVTDLRARLRALDRATGPADAAVSACLAWVADLLVETAERLDDPRTARALMDEAAAVLASAPRRNRTVAHPAPAEPLTVRELTVLRALRKEASLRRVADDLFVSYNTVKSHTSAVYRKLGAHSRAEALSRARERGLIL